MPANRLSDFDPSKITIYGYCADCDHSALVPRLGESRTIPALIERLSCSACASSDTSAFDTDGISSRSAIAELR